jgi:hypothetical protein
LISTRRLAIAFLAAQAAGALVWWCLLLFWPASRAHFRAQDAGDTSLLAFFAADLALFAGASGACAYGWWKRRSWTGPCLWVHAGAAAYAALYCVTLTLLTAGDAWLGALLMSPSLVVPGWLAWHYAQGKE